MVLLPDSCKQILINHLFTKACIQVFSQPNSPEIYFTKVGCGMYATREYYHLIFPQNFSFGHYLFVYAAGDNNVVGLVNATPDNEDKLEDFYGRW